MRPNNKLSKIALAAFGVDLFADNKSNQDDSAKLLEQIKQDNSWEIKSYAQDPEYERELHKSMLASKLADKEHRDRSMQKKRRR